MRPPGTLADLARRSRLVPLGLACALAAVAGEGRAGQTSSRDVADLPEARYTAVHPEPRAPLSRTHDLFRMALRGGGAFSGGGTTPESIELRPSVGLSPLPWRLAPEAARRARLVRFWSAATAGDEMLLSLVLQPGESWCSPELEVGPGARLRLEPVSLARAGDGRLELTERRAGASDTRLAVTDAPGPAVPSAAAQWDVALRPGRGAVCFGASRQPVAVGTPRILQPEAKGADPRPRFVVLTILDTLRKDALEGPDAERAAPTLLALAKRGTRFSGAISPGCHTRAAVSSILSGRDVMRIDPLLRLYFQATGGSQAPASALYSRGNLLVSELAEAAGYYSVFLGNNRFLSGTEAFSRASTQGRRDLGTLDSVALLPALLARHADERVLLVFYVSTPHGLSAAPKRLWDAFGCGSLAGVEAARCTYRARIRHGDEAIAALVDGLADHGLTADTLHVVTSDHGERFYDGEPKLVLRFGRFKGRTDETHGTGCGLTEVEVPLVVNGPGIAAGTRSEPVSTLDVVPTLTEVLGVPRVSQLDGVPLPLGRAAPGPVRAFVSHGFCTDSLIEGSRQLLRWRPDCLREDLEGRRVAHASELWDGSRRVGTNETAPAAVAPAVARLREFIVSRVPGPALILDASRLPGAEITVTALEGRVADFGPSGTADVEGIRAARLSTDGRSLRLELDGYRGLYFVATHPSSAPVSVELRGGADGAAVPLFVGPLQLPLAVAGRPLDPARDAALLVSREEPRAAPDGGLRLWWQPYRPADDPGARQDLSAINSVLREWGYVR